MFQDFEYRTAIDFCLFLGVSLKEYNKEPDIYVYIFALYITALLVLAIGVPCLNINNDFSRWVVCMQLVGHTMVLFFILGHFGHLQVCCDWGYLNLRQTIINLQRISNTLYEATPGHVL